MQAMVQRIAGSEDARDIMEEAGVPEGVGNLVFNRLKEPPATQAPFPPPGFVLAPDEKDIWNGIFKPGQHSEFKGLFHEVTLTNKRLLISERTVKSTSVNKLQSDGYCWPWCWTVFPCCKGDTSTTQSSSSLEKQVDDYVWLPDIMDVQFMRYKNKSDSTSTDTGTTGCMGCGDETHTHTSSVEEFQFEVKLYLTKPVGVTKASWKQWKIDSELKTYHAEMVIKGALKWDRAIELERLLLEIVSRNNATLMATAAAAAKK
ncbi:hypothetical protein FOA52_009692 [Chlamydomonas sp. UWO 241]|nr:hypothetical protein FOA52_009692 [Chlamydomonas sp. UWO 241]